MLLGFVAVIGFYVREFVREEESGGLGAGSLPLKMREIADTDTSGDEGSSDPAATDPELPSFDEAYANPALLQEFGVDGIMFEHNAEKTFRYSGPKQRRRRTLIGVFARVYVLDREGTFRTLASVDCLDAGDVAQALEDQARDLAERLGVQFQVI